MNNDGWRRVTRARPCEVCGRGDWCTRTADGSATCCMRVESAKPLRNGGWLHRRDGDRRRACPAMRRVTLVTPAPATRDWDALAESYRRRVRADALAALARGLGVAADALTRLGIGWASADELKRLDTTCKSAGCWTFPMYAAGRVAGIRLRTPDGFKYAVAGSQQGLFIPADLPGDGPLVIAEGPTDCAALLTLGLAAVGRPSCTGGVKFVCEIARGRDAAIVADGDEPGRRGADALACVLLLRCLSVRVIVPPVGFKDARQWIRAGATRADLIAAMDAAKLWKFSVQKTAAAR